jgi:hypothetical protein
MSGGCLVSFMMVGRFVIRYFSAELQPRELYLPDNKVSKI